MTIAELKALVAAKIAGQGTMVDAGGALPTILDAIADLLATIPAAQIQSDWAQSDNTKVDFIKNKPTIPAAQVQSDWTQADDSEPDYIKHKPAIPQPTLLPVVTVHITEEDGTMWATIQQDVTAEERAAILAGKVPVVKVAVDDSSDAYAGNNLYFGLESGADFFTDGPLMRFNSVTDTDNSVTFNYYYDEMNGSTLEIS